MGTTKNGRKSVKRKQRMEKVWKEREKKEEGGRISRKSKIIVSGDNREAEPEQRMTQQTQPARMLAH